MLDKQTLIDIHDYIQSHSNIQELGVLSEKAICQVNQLESEIFLTTDLEDYIDNHRQPTLNEELFRLIDIAGVQDTEIYQKAGIDRRHFSKIRKPDYRPGKNTTIALALALQLDKEGTDALLSSAGYSLSGSSTFDLIIQYCLKNRIHDMHAVNEALYHFNQKTL
ncbi:hypothetical protein [Paenisporosarcina indica]|uniref:hypothetical protein n=1 Tax=Paenisporosarcina indica TaxID=650093 RepID=UPI0009500D5E|nr:hypothetical protein [Paenisporosarcina indica]